MEQIVKQYEYKTMKHVLYTLLVFSSLVLMGCRQDGTHSPEQLYRLPTKSDKGVRAVVEIPAGTNRKIEYQTQRERFEVDSIRGKERIIDFLPYPGNYGFIPSTYMDPEKGGDGDALDILVISETLPIGTAIETIPIAALLLKDGGEIDTKIIAIPVDPDLRVIDATDFKEFFIKYNAAKYMIELWFLNYKGVGEMELIGWRDERVAMDEIERWIVR